MENITEEKKNGVLAILSIVFGALAIVLEIFALLGLSPILGVICAAVSIIIGIIAICMKNKVVLPVIGITLSALTIIVGILIILGGLIYSKANLNTENTYNYFDNYLNNHSKTGINRLVGTWYDSDKKLYMIINSDNTIELYTTDMSTLYIKGTYTIEQDETETNGDEYIMNVTTTDRKINGESYNDSYTTQFSIITDNYEEIGMMNTITYSALYYFVKIK